jgi:hypothetical protein
MGVAVMVVVIVWVGMIVPVIMTVVMSMHVSVIMAMVMSTRFPGGMMVSTVMNSPRLGFLFNHHMRPGSKILDRLGRKNIDIG